MKTRTTMKLAAVALLAALATGCASPAKREAMVLQPGQVQGVLKNAALRDAVAVAGVTGGKKTNPLWTSEIDDAAFSGALADSLKVAGLAAPSAADAPYTLEARLLSMKEPLFGLNFTVTTTVHYRIVEKSSGKEILSETVAADFTATPSDAFAAIKRLRLAKEGSLRANFAGLIAKIYALNP